jgi:predicted outer membrane repeat protein
MKLAALCLAIASTNFFSVYAWDEVALPISYELQHVDNNLEQLDQPPSSFLRRMTEQITERSLVVGGILCRSGLPAPCICDEAKLRAKFDTASTDAKSPTQIQLCYGTIFRLYEPIDITGKAFSLNCIRPEQCKFRGRGTNIFVGAPIKATFVFLSVEYGEAEQGGAMHLTGGKTKFINLMVQGNFANTTGGAIYVEGENTELEFSGTIFQDNIGENGAGIAVANGAKVRSLRSSFLRNEATISGGGIHIEGSTVDMAMTLMGGNKAPLGSDFYITSDGSSFVDCSSTLVDTFCGGTEGLATAGSSISDNTNCDSRGDFSGVRCKVLGHISSEP